MNKIIFLIISVIVSISCHKENQTQSKWNIIGLNYEGNLNDIFALPSDTIMVLSTLDKTFQKTCIFESNDAGITWTQRCFDKLDVGGSPSFYCFTHLKIYAGDFRSKDGGLNWYKAGDFKVGQMYFFNNNLGIGVSGFTIFKTYNSGNSFTMVYDSSSYVGCQFIQFLDSQIGYASGGASFDNYNSGLIVKTIDGGNTWKPLPGTFKSIIGMSFITPDIGYIIINLYKGDVFTTYESGAELLKTIDGGNTWKSINANLLDQTKIIPFECYFSNELHGYICGAGSGSKILSTDDGGITWNEEYANTSSDFTLNKMIFTSPKAGYAIGNDGLLLKRSPY